MKLQREKSLRAQTMQLNVQDHVSVGVKRMVRDEILITMRRGGFSAGRIEGGDGRQCGTLTGSAVTVR